MFSRQTTNSDGREGFLNRTKRNRDDRQTASKENDSAKVIQVFLS